MTIWKTPGQQHCDLSILGRNRYCPFPNINTNIHEGATQEWTNRTLAVHERSDSLLLVLPGSEFSITEITEYSYFSLFKPAVI